MFKWNCLNTKFIFTKKEICVKKTTATFASPQPKSKWSENGMKQSRPMVPVSTAGMKHFIYTFFESLPVTSTLKLFLSKTNRPKLAKHDWLWRYLRNSYNFFPLNLSNAVDMEEQFYKISHRTRFIYCMWRLLKYFIIYRKVKESIQHYVFLYWTCVFNYMKASLSYNFTTCCLYATPLTQMKTTAINC